MARTVKAAVIGRMGNAGQACNAAKRIIVDDDLYDEFVDQFTAAMSGMHPGDPFDPTSDFGPLSSENAAVGLLSQIQDAVDKGATVRTGGHRVDRPGAFVQATVLTDVTPDMRAFSEELFGPASVIYRVAGADEAIELANSSSFGLGGVFSPATPPRPRTWPTASTPAWCGSTAPGFRGRPALWRDQALGRRTRAGHVRHRRVRQQEAHLHTEAALIVAPRGSTAAKRDRAPNRAVPESCSTGSNLSAGCASERVRLEMRTVHFELRTATDADGDQGQSGGGIHRS
jgi:Aldehyde dehydrogenase family